MPEEIHSTETQLLTMQVLTSHGLNSAGLVASADDGKRFSELGLHRIVLVCLSIPAFGVQLKRLYPLYSKVSVSAFLAEQWSNPNGNFALPKDIQATQNLAACDSGLFAWIESIGVDVVVVSEDTERSLAPSEPGVTQLHSEFTFGNKDLNRVNIALERVNASLEHISRHRVEMFYADHLFNVTQEFERFQLRARRFLEPGTKPQLSDTTFELLRMANVAQSPSELRVDFETVFRKQQSVCIEQLEAMLSCWPVEKNSILKWIGVEAQELQSFFARKSQLDGRKVYRLYEYLHVDASSDLPHFVGGNILIARSSVQVDAVVNSLTHNGNQLAFFEVSNFATISSEWRVVLLWGPSGLPSAILFERGSEEAKLLDDGHWPKMGKREVRSSLVNDLRWTLDNLELLAGFARFGTFLRGKHSEYLCTPEFECC